LIVLRKQTEKGKKKAKGLKKDWAKRKSKRKNVLHQTSFGFVYHHKTFVSVKPAIHDRIHFAKAIDARIHVYTYETGL
jgi:hypothetical protein